MKSSDFEVLQSRQLLINCGNEELETEEIIPRSTLYSCAPYDDRPHRANHGRSHFVGAMSMRQASFGHKPRRQDAWEEGDGAQGRSGCRGPGVLMKLIFL